MKYLAILLTLLLTTTVSAQDMQWTTSHHIGSTGQDRMRDMVTEADGDVYMLIEFSETLTVGDHSFTSKGYTDVALVKSSADGTIFWAQQIGSAKKDYGYGVDVHTDGSVAIAGSFGDDVTVGNKVIQSGGATDGYLAKFNGNGQLQWFNTISGKYYDYASDVAFDNEGNVLVTGWFSGITTFTDYAIQSTNHNDGYLAKYAPTGELTWVQQFEGEGPQTGYSIAVDAANQYYVAGQFEKTMTVGSTEAVSKGFYDAFVMSISSKGDVAWITSYGSDQSETLYEVKVSDAGDIYAAGYFTDQMMVMGEELVSKGFDDAFAVKLDVNGNTKWRTHLGASGWEYARSIAINNGLVAVAGYFSGSITIGDQSFKAVGGEYDYDQFFATYSEVDGSLVYANTMGGQNSDFIYTLEADTKNNGFYMGGEFYGDFESDQPIASNGSNDAIVVRYGEEVTAAPATPLLGMTHSVDNDTLTIALNGTDAEDIYYLSTEINFDPAVVSYKGARSSNPSQHIFVDGLQDDSTIGISIGKMSTTSIDFNDAFIELVFTVEDSFTEQATFSISELTAEDNGMSSIDVMYQPDYTVTFKQMLAVWPGDADNDEDVCENDVLALAYNWGVTGEPREGATMDWKAQKAKPWTDTLATYSDTDGNGVVDHNDLRAITYNFGEVCGSKAQGKIAANSTQSGDNIVFELEQLKAGESTTFTITNEQAREVLGFATKLELNGLNTGDYQITNVSYGSWAQQWMVDYSAIEFQRSVNNKLSIAVAQKGRSGVANIASGEVIAEITIEALKDWSESVPVNLYSMNVTESNGENSKAGNSGDINITTDREVNRTDVIQDIKLNGNYPNPFNPSTQISFELPDNMHVNITVYNAMGQRVATLLNGELSAGAHEIPFLATNLASGTYLYQLQADGYMKTQKMTLVK